MYDHVSREACAKRAREERFAEALNKLDSEMAAHDYLIQHGNPASHITQENIVKLGRHVDKCRQEMNDLR